MSAKNLVHRSSKKRYKIPTEIVESFILVKKEERRSQNPSDTFQQLELDWRETQLHFTERKKKKREGITNRPSLFNHRTEPVVFSLPRGDRLISPEIVSRKQGHGALNHRSIVTRAKTGKNWLAPPRVPTLIDIRRTDGWRVRSGRPRMHDSRPFHCAFTLRAGVRVQGSDGRTALKIETDWPIGREKKRRGWKVGRSVRKRQW